MTLTFDSATPKYPRYQEIWIKMSKIGICDICTNDIISVKQSKTNAQVYLTSNICWLECVKISYAHLFLQKVFLCFTCDIFVSAFRGVKALNGFFTNMCHIHTNNSHMCDKFVCVKIAVQHRFVSWLVILKLSSVWLNISSILTVIKTDKLSP